MLINRRIIIISLILTLLIGKNVDAGNKRRHKKVDSLLAEKTQSSDSIGERDKESPSAENPESGQRNIDEESQGNVEAISAPSLLSTLDQQQQQSHGPQLAPSLLQKGEKAPSLLPQKRQSAPLSLLQQEQQEHLAPSLLQQEQLAPSLLQQEQLTPSILEKSKKAPSLLQKEQSKQEQQEQLTPSLLEKSEKAPSLLQQGQLAPSLLPQKKQLAPSLLQQEQQGQLAPSLLQKEEQLKQEQQEELTPSLLHKRQLAWSLSRQKQLASSFLQEEQLAPSLLPQKKQLAPSLLQKEQLKQEQKEQLAQSLLQQEQLAPSLLQQEQKEQLAPSLLQKGEKASSLLSHGKKAPSILQEKQKAPSLLQKGEKAPSLLQHGKLAPSLLEKGEKAQSLMQPGKLAPSLLEKGEKAQSLVQHEKKAQSLVQPGKLAPSLLSPTEPAADSDVNLNILNEGRRAGTWLDSSIIDAYLERIVSSGRPRLEFVPNFIIDMYVGNKKEHAEEIGNWIMKIDWLAIQLLFVPVFLAPNHWAMGVYRPSEQEFTMFDSNTALGRVSEKIEFMGKMTDFFADIGQIHGQTFDEDVHLVERTNTPQQDNDSDCGVFALMFAYYIGKERRILDNFNHCNMNAKAFREKIYQDIYAIKFGQHTKQQAQISQTTGHPQSIIGHSSKSARSGSTSESGAEPSRSKITRQRSVHVLPEIEKDDKDAEQLKSALANSLFSNKKIEQLGLSLYMALFHYKRLSWSILVDLDKSKFAELREQIDRRKLEHLRLLTQPSELVEQDACRFYKFLIRLKDDEILAQSAEWAPYLRFRMRHFYWISEEWEKNTAEMSAKLNFESSDCTFTEYGHFAVHCTTPPLSWQSNYWSLRWLLNNSPVFNNQIDKLDKGNLMEFKRKMLELTGVNGFYRLEMSAPLAMNLERPVEQFSLECLKRVLVNDHPDKKRYELRMALGLLLKNMFIFRDFLADAEDDADDDELEFYDDNLNKFDDIHSRILDEVLPLINEERSLEEEEIALNRMVCIELKFHEITSNVARDYSLISVKSFAEISLPALMRCTREEMESSLERQRLVLAQTNYKNIETFIMHDLELQSILKKSTGSIYRLNVLLGGEVYLRQLWHAQKESIRSKTYFTDHSTVDEYMRKSYQAFLAFINSSENRYLYKISVNIYAVMKWLESKVGNNRSFYILIEDWRCAYRNWFDQLHVLQTKQAKRIDMEMSVMSAKIVAFVKKTHSKQKNAQRLADEFLRDDLTAEEEAQKRIEDNLPVPSLPEDVQIIHLMNMQTFAVQDRSRKKVKETELNFWHFFKILPTMPEQIALICQLFDTMRIKELYEQLGLEFQADKFPQQQQQVGMSLIKETTGQSATRVQSLLKEETSAPRLQSLLKKETSTARVQSLLKEETSTAKLQSLLKEEGLSKSAKKKLKRNKSKVSTTSAEDEEKIVEGAKLRRSESAKGSGRGRGRAGTGATVETVGEALRRSESAKEAKGGKKLPQSMASKFSDTEDAEQRRRRNLKRFNLEHRRSSIASAEGGTPSWRREETTSAPRGSQILESGTTHGSSAKEQIKEFLEGSRSRTTERQRSGGRQTLARSLVESEQQQQLLMFLHKSCWKNNHLYMLYENFLANPTILMRAVLDACVYINETFAKLSLAEIISDYGRRKWPIPLWQINEGKVERLKEKWQQIVDQQLVLVKAKEDIDKLKTNLHALLYQVQMVLNEGGGGDEGRQSTSLIDSSSSMEEMGDALFQMHSIKLSHFLCIKSENQRWIDKFMERSKNAVFGLLHQSEDLSAELRVSRKNYQRFLDRIEAWDKYENQRALDDQLVTQYRVRDDDFMPRKSHYWQQIILGNTEKETHSTMTKELQEKIKFVDRFIEAAERMEYERAQTFKTAVDAVEQIAREWNKDAELLHTGSYLIGALTVNSDVDTICMLPERITLDMFFGNAKCEIVETKPGRGGGISRTRTCADHSSLHCAFCLNPNVMYLSKVETARVPLLKFSYCLDEDIRVKKFTKCEKEVEFDLLFAAVKQAGVGYDIDGHAKLLQAMDERAMDREQIATYTSLTGYQQNTAINGVLSRNKRNFRITVAAIKHWAKKYHIYNPFHGFLKGIGVTIMAAKIATMFPNSTVPFLLQMFFFYFLEWPWKMPVQLMKVQNLTRDGKPFWEIEERSKREQWHAHLGISTELMMPVVSPWREDDISFSSSNVMTENTREIVFKAMQNALYSLNQIQAGQADWDLLLNGMDISAEYQYFIVINCGRRYQKLSDDLCSFTNSKLANQIIYDVVKNNRNFTNIRSAHIMHTTGDSDNRCIVPGGGQVYNTHFCKTWLVGIKFFPHGENNFLKEHFEQRLHKENLLIVEKYMGTLGRKENKQKFDEFTRNRADYFILSKFVQLKELAQWGITLRGSEILHQ